MTALYTDIVRGLQSQPGTGREVAERHGICACTARALLRELHTVGILRVSGWRRVGNCGPLDRLFTTKPGEDVPPPLSTVGRPLLLKPPKRSRPRPAVIAFAALWEALHDPSTAHQIAEECGMGQQAIYRFLAHARSLRLVRVSGWVRIGVVPVALYALGSKADVPRPERMPNAAVKRRCRQRKAERVTMALLGGLAA